MSESLLKRTFQEKDLQRARNLISGQYGAATTSQVGYEKVEEEHKEGDVWTDGSGKTWTIEDGIKVSVPKLQKARDLHQIPLMCPRCGKPMNTRLDKKIYPLHGMCYDCVLKFEEALKRAGLYKEYERNIVLGNLTGFLRRVKDMLEDEQKDQKIGFVTGEGEIENWGTSTVLSDHLADWIKVMSEIAEK